MKTLLVMRHAKSSWADPGMKDHSRPLNKRGRRSAPIMAQRISVHKNLPQKVLSSDSQRTRETASLMMDEGLFAGHQIQYHERLYLASAADLIEACMEFGAESDCLMLLAHNPGMTYLVNHISDARLDNLPTAGVACIEFDIDSWKELETKTGKLLWLEFPRMFE